MHVLHIEATLSSLCANQIQFYPYTRALTQPSGLADALSICDSL